MKTPEQLKGAIRNIAASKNLRSQEVLQMFLFERILERLSVSPYRNNFILKGGLLISSMLGISRCSVGHCAYGCAGSKQSKCNNSPDHRLHPQCCPDCAQQRPGDQGPALCGSSQGTGRRQWTHTLETDPAERNG